MGCSLDVVPTLWASYAIFGHLGLSDGVHLKNDIDKVVTVTLMGKVLRSMPYMARDRLHACPVGLNPTKFD